MDILTGENLSSREWMGIIVILASCEYHFIRVYENLVQHPSNNISISRTWVTSIGWKTISLIFGASESNIVHDYIFKRSTDNQLFDCITFVW